jgi:Spy/CpxP family protein refolding chaperone
VNNREQATRFEISTIEPIALDQRHGTAGDLFTVLSNPADPNYAAALQDLQARLAARIQEQSQVQQALYKVLTPTQQQQLPQLLAAMKATMAQHGAT